MRSLAHFLLVEANWIAGNLYRFSHCVPEHGFHMTALHLNSSGEHVHKLRQGLVNRDVTVIKKWTTLQLAKLLLPQFKQALDDEEIYLRAWCQLNDFLACNKLTAAKKAITNELRIAFGIIF